MELLIAVLLVLFICLLIVIPFIIFVLGKMIPASLVAFILGFLTFFKRK